MLTVEVPTRIKKIISMFYLIGFWHDENRSRFRKWILSSWYLVVYGYYPFSLVAGALICDSNTERIFLGVMSTVAGVAAVRLYYFVLNKDRILKHIREIGAHTINGSEDEFHRVFGKLNVFMRFAYYYVIISLSAIVSLIIIALPMFSTVNRLPFNIFIPLDWRSNEIYYWIVYTFVSYEALTTVVCTLFNVIIWYLMLAIVLEYDILGNDFKNMGWADKTTTSALFTALHVDGKPDLFDRELILLIKRHRFLQEETMRFKLLFSNLFLIQLATSGLGICGTVFALAFSSSRNPVEYGIYVISVLYCLFDILSSENLSYKLFACNWMDQSQASKKFILILMEVLKRPQQLVIGIFPLDLEIFTTILNLAYRMFNVIRA